MIETTIIALVLFAVLFIGREAWEEWKILRLRRNREDMRHVLGARQWWGKR